jgi:acetyltransferase-like isoleucine patch superfamily enzyme
MFNAMLTHLPALIANGLKLQLLRLCGANIGVNVRLGTHVKILGPWRLHIEDDVSIAYGVTLDARGGLVLRRGSLIGFQSVLLTYTHVSDNPEIPVHWQGAYSAPVVVERNAWLGARCLVLPGNTIGEGSIVAAMSVVSRSVPARVVAAGQPATPVRSR